MAKKKSKPQKHLHYHKDESLWAKGEMLDGVMVGYWECFRKEGTIMRSGSFENGTQVGDWTTYDKLGKVYKVTKMKAKSAN
jgi:antitoxin component YwqK of YwqJK toxin-antitoxin module